MKGNLFNLFTISFFKGFQELESFLGKKLTYFIFTILPLSYFIYLFFIGIWDFYSSDEYIQTNDGYSQTIKNIFMGAIWIVYSALKFYSYIKNLSDIDLKILKFSRKFYSEETVKLCFEPIIADWKKEYSDAVSIKENWKAYRITMCYVYAFLSAIFMQSPIGRLIKLIKKIVK